MNTEKFISLRNEFEFTQTEFGNYLGDAKSTADIERQKSEISARALVKLMHDKNINPLWLFDKSPDKYYLKKEVEVSPKVISLDSESRENIVLVNAKAAAGYPQNIADVSWYQKLPAFDFPIPEFRNATYRGFQVEGDSMYPNLKNKDWVLAKALSSINEVTPHNIYVVVLYDSVMVKKIQNCYDGSVELISINESYEPYRIETNQIQEIWQVSSRLSFGVEEPTHSKLLNQLKESMETLKKQLQQATTAYS